MTRTWSKSTNFISGPSIGIHTSIKFKKNLYFVRFTIVLIYIRQETTTFGSRE